MHIKTFNYKPQLFDELKPIQKNFFFTNQNSNKLNQPNIPKLAKQIVFKNQPNSNLDNHPMQTAQVIACSKVITLHLLQSRQPTAVYNPHKGIVNCVDINHTNKVIASCGQDGRIVLVNALKPDNEVFETSFHTQPTTTSLKPVSVNTIMFSGQSHYIAAGSSDCLVKIWDMKNHKHVFSTIKSHVASVNSLAWIRNLGMEKVQGDVLASASSIGDIFLHSVKTSNIVETFNTKNQESVNQIKVSQSEGHCRLAASTASGSVMVWNLRNIEKSTEAQCYFNNGKKSSITSVSFSSFNPVLLASSSMDETLTFYDINEKKSVKVITSQEPLTSITFHSDGHTLIAGGMYGALFLYDLRKPSKPREKLIGHDSAIKHTVFIKEHDPTKPMSNSRASSSSSVNSFNSRTQSNRSINDEQKQVKVNNFVDPQNRRVIDMSQEAKKKETSSLEALQPKRQVTGVKLSSTGQQALKNAQQKPSVVRSTTPSVTAPSSYTYYNKPPTDPSTSTPPPPATLPNSKPTSQHSLPKPSTLQQDPSSTYSKPLVSFPPKSQSLPVTSRSTNDSSVQQLKQLIEDRFQNLHMELIRQFHHQQKEMKEMISGLLIEDRKKTEKIKELETQVMYLKNHTY